MRSEFATALGVALWGVLSAGPAWAEPAIQAPAARSIYQADPSHLHHHGFPLHLIGALVLLLVVLNLTQGVLMLMARRTMRRALSLAENRAAAADRAIEDAKRDKRPLVLMKALRLEPFSPGAERYAVNDESYLKSVCGELWNEGSALGAVTAVRIQCRLAPAIGDMLPADEASAVLHGRKPLGMGEVWSPERPLQAAWLNSSFDKHLLTLFAWGWVKYADNFGVVRRSGFAFEYVPTGEGGNGGEFRPCGPSTYWFDVEDAPA